MVRRTRDIQKKIWLTPQEERTIAKKMEMIGTENFGAYARKMLIDGYIIVVWEDRLDMAVSLAELGIDSIPINALMPIPGTPLEHLPELSEPDILRTIAFFRYINPEANIRLAAGRALLTNDGETAFKAGASASITGNMLTTVACATIRSDRQMLADLGRQVKPVSRKDV